MPILLALALLAQPPAPAEVAAIPQFKDFLVETTFKGTPAVPKLRTTGYKAFQARIQEAAKQGPNFAGQYTVVEWGCGTYCVAMAIIDSKKGKLYPAPFGILESFGEKYYGDTPDKESVRIEYQMNSRLLIARGCPDTANCATYFYEWQGSKFNLLHKIPAIIDADLSPPPSSSSCENCETAVVEHAGGESR